MKREHVQEELVEGVWIHTPKYPMRITVPAEGDIAAR
jgi:hypothetical protein